MVSQMLYLASADPHSDITIYINSPGGSVQAGLAIFDTMQYIPCDVKTVCFGMAASMGAFLLSSGTKGKRKSLPNSRIMIHQPLGGSQGEATDLEITAKLMLHTKEVLNTYMSEFCQQPIDKLRSDTDRDFYMTPDEALTYGLIDEVIQHKNMIKRPKIPSLKVYFFSFFAKTKIIFVYLVFVFRECSRCLLLYLFMILVMLLILLPRKNKAI
jgi:ATP-dependent Clp endopeptidase proteolytic subunit ClpP